MNFDLNKAHCYYFNELCKIPHGSTNEEAISDYFVEFAKKHNLDFYRDDIYNVIIYKPGSKGYENSDPLILQGHSDMVCEANKSANFDFTKDPLKLYVDDEGWLHADGTTLGADDGMGIAYMLAILADEDLPHPPLECIFTVQEEIGLIGALHLDPSKISAKRMICLDGGGEIETCISTAGGTQVTSDIKGNIVSNNKKTYSLFVSGLSGGHSGSEISKEKGNANKLAVRLIKNLDCPVNIVSIEGGLKENAIPRECELVFATDSEFMSKFEKDVEDIKVELEFSDNGFKAEIKEIEQADKCFDDASSKKIIDFIYLLPNGLIARSMAIPGLTLTSLNTGIIETNDDHVVITSSLRSAVDSGIKDLVLQIRTLASLFTDINITTSSEYPGWNYVPVSPLRDKLAVIVLEKSGKELIKEAVHAGNECGVFSSYGVKDIVSYGAISKYVHTPDEKLDLASFDRSYDILTTLIKECK